MKRHNKAAWEERAKRGHAWGECKRKDRFATEGDAHTMIASRRRRGWVGPLRTYECRFCGGFHLTSQPVRETRVVEFDRREAA